VALHDYEQKEGARANGALFDVFRSRMCILFVVESLMNCHRAESNPRPAPLTYMVYVLSWVHHFGAEGTRWRTGPLRDVLPTFKIFKSRGLISSAGS